MKKRFVSRAAVLFVLLISGIGLAQDQTLRVGVDLVLLDVSVADKESQSVRDLRREHFTVYEDKVEQNISYFSTEESPVSWGVVVDRSGSMTDMNDVYDAALHMIKGGISQDEMFTMTFSRTIDSLSEHTWDRRALQNALFGLQSKGATALWDAVDSALDYIKLGQHRKKALLVITDGTDNKSRISFSRLRDRVRESDVVIYTVGINTPSGVFAKGRNERDLLTELADTTGGYAHFPDDPEKCRATMEEIAREVSEHYTIGYHPTNGNYDGTWRKIKVSATASDNPQTKYVVRTRTGYFSTLTSN